MLASIKCRFITQLNNPTVVFGQPVNLPSLKIPFTSLTALILEFKFFLLLVLVASETIGCKLKSTLDYFHPSTKSCFSPSSFRDLFSSISFTKPTLILLQPTSYHHDAMQQKIIYWIFSVSKTLNSEKTFFSKHSLLL